MRLLLLFLVLLLCSCNYDIGPEYPETDTTTVEPDEKGFEVIVAATNGSLTSAKLFINDTLQTLISSGDIYYAKLPERRDFDYRFEVLTEFGGDTLEEHNWYWDSRMPICFLLKDSLSKRLLSQVSFGKYLLKPFYSSDDTLQFDSTGAVYSTKLGQSGRWYSGNETYARIIWNDSAMDKLFWIRDTLCRIQYKEVEDLSRPVAVDEYLAVPSLTLSLSSPDTFQLRASWTKTEWNKECDSLTLYYAPQYDLDTTTAQKITIADSGASYLFIDDVFDNQVFSAQLVARRADNSLFAQSDVVRCTTENVAPKPFSFSSYLTTDRYMLFQLPDLTFADFKSISIGYNRDYSGGHSKESWDNLIEITDPDCTSIRVGVWSDSPYTFRAYLEDTSGLVTQSKMYITRSKSGNFDAPELQYEVLNDSSVQFSWAPHNGLDFLQYELRGVVDDYSVVPTAPLYWSSTNINDTLVVLDSLFHKKNIYSFRAFVLRTDSTKAGSGYWQSDTLLISKALPMPDGVHLEWKNTKTTHTYRIYRKPVSATSWTQIHSQLYYKENTFIDTTVTTGNYYYKVTATNGSTWQSDSVFVNYPWP